MATTRAIGNKIKGEWKQIKGNINQQSGRGVKGGMQKITGKLQQGLGDAELNYERNRPRNRNSI